MPDQVTEWLDAARRELGLEDAVASTRGLDAAGALAELVGDQVDPVGIAPSVFLLGVAAGRAADPGIAAHDFVEKLGALARSWNADTERSATPHDPSRRG